MQKASCGISLIQQEVFIMFELFESVNLASQKKEEARKKENFREIKKKKRKQQTIYEAKMIILFFLGVAGFLATADILWWLATRIR